jgi:glycosyltransferase involved in cell wall biosynthesis
MSLDFTIIIPTFDRPGQLARCLRSLCRLDYPRDRFEVIVVDDGSISPLDAVVDPIRRHLDITLLRQANRGPAIARNTGAACARGRFLAFTDDDCEPAVDWLRCFARRLAGNPQCLIGGRTINRLGHNLFSSASQLIIDVVYQHYNARFDDALFFPSNNFAITREGYDSIGGFDEHWPLAAAEDRDFCDRWRLAGRRMIYAPEAVIAHSHKLSLTSFFRQHFNYGRGAHLFHQARANRGSGGVKVEGSFYRKAIAWPFAHETGHRTVALFLLLIVWQVANTLGFFYQAMSHRRIKPLRSQAPAIARSPYSKSL